MYFVNQHVSSHWKKWTKTKCNCSSVKPMISVDDVFNIINFLELFLILMPKSNQIAKLNYLYSCPENTAICGNSLFKHCMWLIWDWRNKVFKNVKTFEMKSSCICVKLFGNLRVKNFDISMYIVMTDWNRHVSNILIGWFVISSYTLM